MMYGRGSARVQQIYESRETRAKELKAEGRKIIGYLCCFPPLEIMTAADLVPFRIFGDVREPLTRADAHLETQTCPFIRSCFDLGLKGKYDFLDGFVAPHSCDPVYFVYRIWKYHLQPSYSHFIQVPHVPDNPTSVLFFKRELERFKRSIEQMTGKEISSQRLREAVELHNQNRRLLRQLNQLRKENPPLISGVEMSRTVIANMSLPVEEGNELLRNVLTEKTTSPVASAVARARVFIYGSELDDVAFLQLVEENGAWVVMDDIGVGTRFYWHDVEITPDPLEGLAERYLLKIKCPRTYWRGKPEERFRYIWDYVRDFAVQGAILYSYRFCDAHALDIPELKDYLRSQGLPAIPVESDYNLSSIAALKTRVQAFIEMLGQSGF